MDPHMYCCLSWHLAVSLSWSSQSLSFDFDIHMLMLRFLVYLNLSFGQNDFCESVFRSLNMFWPGNNLQTWIEVTEAGEFQRSRFNQCTLLQVNFEKQVVLTEAVRPTQSEINQSVYLRREIMFLIPFLPNYDTVYRPFVHCEKTDITRKTFNFRMIIGQGIHNPTLVYNLMALSFTSNEEKV